VYVTISGLDTGKQRTEQAGGVSEREENGKSL